MEFKIVKLKSFFLCSLERYLCEVLRDRIEFHKYLIREFLTSKIFVVALMLENGLREARM